MNDSKIIANIEAHIDAGKSISNDSLLLLVKLYRSEIERLKSAQVALKPLASGLKQLKGTQAKVFDYLIFYIEQNGISPAVREIGEGVGLSSSSTIHGHLDRLEAKGYIKRLGNRSTPRNIQIVGKRESVKQ